MKKFLQITIPFFCVCFISLISSQNIVAQTTWTGNASTDWNNANNWTAGIPNTSTDVIIPANCATYPVLTSGNACRNIYMAAGARIQNQHLLTYTKAYVEISVNTNRYVRITPPLKETYSGDFFTKEQGGEWSNFTPAQYKPTDGTTGKNRIYPGGTYQSLFSETSTQRGNYGETAVSTFTSGWADPKNALNTKYKPLQALDVWVDTKEDGVATFHFPSQETTYYYYDQNGKKQSFGESTPRTAESGRFVYDNAYANGVYDIEYDRSNNANDPAFALGNPAMAYLDIREFLRLNGGSNITPYVYRHNEVSLDRGTETILYYNKSANKLYQVGNTSTTTGTEVATTDAHSYIAPAHACRVVSIPTEPRLIGRYSCTYSCPEIKLYRRKRKYDHYQAWPPKNIWLWTYNNATVSFSKESHTLTIKPNETSPDQVVLVNFAGKGTSINATVKPTDENHGTITIANGTYISYANNDWENGDKKLYIYGANTKTPTLVPSSLEESNYTQGAQYVHTDNPKDANIGFVFFDYYSQYATNLDYDIVIDYTIANDGTLSLSLRNGFAIYNQELKNGTKTNLVKKSVFDNQNSVVLDNNDNKNNTSRGNLVAWWVYNEMTASKGTTSTQDVFILPAALGNYTTNIRNNESIIGNPGVTAGSHNITIRRYGNSYDQVTISGFFPGHDSYVLGTITYDGSKYTLTIPDGQMVKKVSDTDVNLNYHLYSSKNKKRTNNNIVLTWDNSKWSSSANQYAQVSHYNSDPSNSKPGFFWYRAVEVSPAVWDDFLYLENKTSTTEDNAVGTPPPSQETTVTQVALRFTPDMFKANPTITSGASLAPRRQGQKDTVTSPIVNIRATGEGVSGNTLIVVDSTARNDYSMAEDAPLFDVQNYEFCLATLAGEQVVGVNVVKNLDIIPLYIQSKEQILTLHFENIEALGEEIELYDALTEDSVLITPGTCSIDIDLLDSEEAGRFFLRRRVSQAPVVPEGPATELPSTTETTLQAWSPMKGVAVVHTVNVTKDAQVYVIDMNGRIVHQAPVVPLHTVRGLSTGTYIIKVGTPTNHQEIKLLVE